MKTEHICQFEVMKTSIFCQMMCAMITAKNCRQNHQTRLKGEDESGGCVLRSKSGSLNIPIKCDRLEMAVEGPPATNDDDDDAYKNNDTKQSTRKTHTHTHQNQTTMRRRQENKVTLMKNSTSARFRHLFLHIFFSISEVNGEERE